MNKIVIILLVALLSASCATSSNIDDYPVFYKKYKKQENVVNFKLPSGLIRAFLDKEDKEIKHFLKHSKGVRFFIAEEPDEQLYAALKSHLPEDVYKDIMIVKDGGDQVYFKAREEKESITEIIILVEEETSFVVMSIEGKFTFEDMHQLIKSVDVKKVSEAKE